VSIGVVCVCIGVVWFDVSGKCAVGLVSCRVVQGRNLKDIMRGHGASIGRLTRRVRDARLCKHLARLAALQQARVTHGTAQRATGALAVGCTDTWDKHRREYASVIMAAAFGTIGLGAVAFQEQAIDERGGSQQPVRTKPDKKQSMAGKKKPDNELKRDYKLGHVLGEGTFAVVRLGVDRRNKTRVAIKEISKELSEVEALENEIQIMETTGQHDNVVSLRDVFDGKDTLYLVMDLAEGGELFDRIIEQGELSEQAASTMFLSAVKGVDHLHRHHIAHLDIKPENLLLTSHNDDAGIKVADFGLAINLAACDKAREEAHIRDEELRVHNVGKEKRTLSECVGTPAYWAPEMVKNERFDEKVDIWALGCVLYIMLCGTHPFDPQGDATEAQILARVAKGDYDRSNASYQEISQNAKNLIRHMLDPNPETRFSTKKLLRHPWLRESGELSTQPLKNDHITRLRGFRIIRLLRQGMQHMVGDAASDLFGVFDTDGDGFICGEELKSALELIGQKISKRELKQMLKMLDTDNDGRISREEFNIVLRAPPGSPYSSMRQKRTSVEDLEFLFRVFDRDKDGYIEFADFRHVLGLLGACISESLLLNQISLVDVDKDGKVDFTEFVQFWRMMEKEKLKEGYQSVNAVHVKQRRTRIGSCPGNETPEQVEGEGEEEKVAVAEK